MSDSAQTASYKPSPAWVKWVLSPAAFVLLAGVLACAWVLAQHSSAATHPVETMSWTQLSSRSWFIKAWIWSTGVLALPAAAGYGIGWLVHRSSSSAVGAALAAVAVVFMTLWQFGDKRADAQTVVVAPPAALPAAVAPAPAASAAPAQAAAEKPEPITPPAAADVAMEALKTRKQQEEPAAKAAAQTQTPGAALARQQQAAPAAPMVPMLADRNQMFVQVETSAPTSTAGVMPPPPSMQNDKAQAHPVFPGCRWATPTTWVCDQPKP
jgi:hypothetical protein